MLNMACALLLHLAEEERENNVLRFERRRLRDISDPLQLTEKEFIANFRLTKAAYQQVLEVLQCYLPVTLRTTAILATLNFYANGSYQRNVGASVLNNMSQPTLSKCLNEVTNALNAKEVLLAYIKFPSTQTARELIMTKYMEKFGFPGVIGCIDGTHVALIRPKDHEETFFNRKNYHSLNVLLISDANLNITHVDASYGGASHDSYVWNQSLIKPYLESLHRNGEYCWLLGDSGYAQRPWMMTPVLGSRPGTPEEYYTRLHCTVRNTVERCIGVLKARWRCLFVHRVLHYDPVKSGKIINACVVLHNIANAQNVPMPELQSEDITDDYQQEVVIPNQPYTMDNRRNLLIQRLWNARTS